MIGFADGGGRRRRRRRAALDQPIVQAGRAGAAIALSIDLRVQAALQDELDRAAQAQQAAGAVGIVINVRTGEILGMASWPTFDPNDPVAGGDAGHMVNHAAATVYEPGSVFKVFTLAMGLDSGVATLDTMFDVRQPLRTRIQTIHDYDATNVRLPLWEVFTHSSNIGAAQLALAVGARHAGPVLPRASASSAPRRASWSSPPARSRRGR